MTLVSVVICTYNRARHLDAVLTSLAEQTVGRECFEVVVIDNNSTDDTVSVARRWLNTESSLALRYCVENRQGLSYARNRGAMEAAGQYVAYLDDDAKAPAEWLAVAMAIIADSAPSIFGGPYYPFYESARPAWWRDEYRTGEHGSQPCMLKDWQFLSGGNLFIKKELVEQLGGFDPQLGMQGNKVGLGEETLLQMRFRAARPDLPIFYDSRLFIWHLVHQSKMTLRWLVPFWLDEGRNLGRLWRLHEQERCRRFAYYQLLSSLCRVVGSALLAMPFRDRQTYPDWRNYLAEVVADDIREVGKHLETVKSFRNRHDSGL